MAKQARIWKVLEVLRVHDSREGRKAAQSTTVTIKTEAVQDDDHYLAHEFQEGDKLASGIPLTSRGSKQELWRCPNHGIVQPRVIAGAEWPDPFPDEPSHPCPLLMSDEESCSEQLERVFS